MTNRRIIDQTEALSLSGDDYLIADNANLGTRRIQFTRLLSGATPLPPDYMVGFKCLKTDFTKFSVDSGYARSSDNLRNMQLTTSLIKNILLTFDLGNDAGCMPSGLTLQANTKYYIFLITKSSGEADIIVDTDENCSNGLADNVVILNNFDKYVLLGSFKTNTNSQIQDIIYYKTAGILIKTYLNGTSWYRIYADGWCEQGGKTSKRSSNSWLTVNLLVSFRDSNYTVLQSNIGGWQENESGTVKDITQSSFKIFAWSGRASFWEARGFIL